MLADSPMTIVMIVIVVIAIVIIGLLVALAERRL